MNSIKHIRWMRPSSLLSAVFLLALAISLPLAAQELPTAEDAVLPPVSEPVKLPAEGEAPVHPRQQQVNVGDDPDAFSPDDSFPQYNPLDIARHASYPEEARRDNIEGDVVIKVLVDRYGRVARTMIERSDNSKLNEAAVEAVTATDFRPAMQNGQPVKAWTTVKVMFRLSDK